MLVKRKPMKSRGGVSGSLMFGMKTDDRAMPRRPIGILMKKIQRQWKKVVMKPPRGGPTTGPTRAGIVRVASA
jgi:hypothetical protein